MKRNKKAFYWVAEAIETYPQMHDQGQYVQGLAIGALGPSSRPTSMNRKVFVATEVFVGSQRVSCGATQCAAGWALAYEYGSLTVVADRVLVNSGESISFTAFGIDKAAGEILGLDEEEATILFHNIPQEAVDWPRLLRSIGDGEDFDTAIFNSWLQEMDDEQILAAIEDSIY